MKLYANLVDIHNRRIYPATLVVEENRIIEIIPGNEPAATYILPGFVDAHIHVESSMLVPSEFARIAVTHGTVATISDPHEIANVCGVEGVKFMIENGKQVPFTFGFGAPSCVPATSFETAGAVLDAKDVEALMAMDEIYYLSEVMNYPGVLAGDAELMAKIAAAQKYNKPVDGHAPGLMGEAAVRYIQAGIHTDHECVSYEEAKWKLAHGMKILIREGSAAKNFEALAPLISEYPDKVMFCSDDKHPDNLVQGHINELVLRAVAKGFDLFDVLQIACVNPVLHYKLPTGLLRVGDRADFIEVKSLEGMEIENVWIQGIQVVKAAVSQIQAVPIIPINQFDCALKKVEEFQLKVEEGKELLAIEALDGQLITRKYPFLPLLSPEGYALSDVSRDILKITVVNRYHNAPPAVAFIKNFGLKTGAIASSVGHDSHNIIAVGTNDADIQQAVNQLILAKGGISVVEGDKKMTMPLAVGGIMSKMDAHSTAEQYEVLDLAAKELGATLAAPFMTLSFMALLVIPHLKLSDKGLFDADSFSFV